MFITTSTIPFYKQPALASETQQSKLENDRYLESAGRLVTKLTRVAMPIAYAPASDAIPIEPWSTAFLSQRDLELQIPLNYVTYPGISLAAACFGDSVYEDEAAALCFSNLLALQIRRYVLDLYWDSGRRVWSFCPVEVSRGNTAPGTSTAITASSPSSSGQPSIALGSLSTSRSAGTATTAAARRRQVEDALEEIELLARQASTTANTGSNIASSHTSTVASSANPSSTSSPASTVNGSTLFRNGPYSCTSSIDLPVFTTVLVEYLRNSSNTLAAVMTYLEFNLHVAAPLNAPLQPPAVLTGSALPTGQESLVDVLAMNLTLFSYTPVLLNNDRVNLNSTWFSIPMSYQPDPNYINFTANSGAQAATQTGWPSEGYVVLGREYRLLSAFGTIDPQLSGYNRTSDERTVFPPGSISAPRNVAYNQAGVVSQGCSYNPQSNELSQTNNSWAVTTDLDLQSLNGFGSNTIYESIYNLTACGVSPMLNTTLANSSAGTNILAYKDFADSIIWSWSAGEPRQANLSDPDDSKLRCALLEITAPSDSSSSLPNAGRWRVANCGERHPAACHYDNAPYNWVVPSNAAAYSYADDVCPDGTTFDVPSSGLENTYLTAAAIQSLSSSSSDNGSITIWVDLNSLDVAGCWVTGRNSTCPYSQNTDVATRRIIVPVVAGILVLVIAALTLFVKCAANRQSEKRGRKRKNVGDGWDYEGVPS